MTLTNKKGAATVGRWSPGTAVAVRGIAHKQVWITQAVRVIQDTTDLLAVYLQPGAQCWIRSGLISRKYCGSANNGSRSSTPWTWRSIWSSTPTCLGAGRTRMSIRRAARFNFGRAVAAHGRGARGSGRGARGRLAPIGHHHRCLIRAGWISGRTPIGTPVAAGGLGDSRFVLKGLVSGLRHPIGTRYSVLTKHQIQLRRMFLNVTHAVELQLKEGGRHPLERANFVGTLVG